MRYKQCGKKHQALMNMSFERSPTLGANRGKKSERLISEKCLHRHKMRKAAIKPG